MSKKPIWKNTDENSSLQITRLKNKVSGKSTVRKAILDLNEEYI